MRGNAAWSISPPLANLFNSITVNMLSPECLGADLMAVINRLSGAAWTANLLTFVPLMTTRPLLVSQFFWHNGATVNGETDVGIYNADGTVKLGSTGPTTNSGASQIQVVDVTNFTLTSNSRFWLALGSNSGTHTYWRSDPVANAQDFLGIKQQASGWSSGLPSSATFAVPSVAVLPHFGFTGGVI